MYEAFFGLRERPFDLTPNPRFLLMTPTHREALANLQYGVSARKGLTVVIGEAGSGKTTLIGAAMRDWKTAGHNIAQLNNPTLTRPEFFEYLALAFGLSVEAAASKARFLVEFTDLVTRRGPSQISGLVIDEAQRLSDDLLEEVRLLVNVETETEKLFQVVLVGQPELATRLNEPGLRQIKQRIALRCTLTTLDVRQTAAYIAGRLQIAGGIAGQIFTREAVQAIHRHANGIPRVISVISDNALLAAYAAGVKPVTSAHVEDVCKDFDIDVALPRTDDVFQVVATPPSTASVSPPMPAELPREVAPVHGRRTQEQATAASSGEGGLFQHYIAAGKRRFSFF